MEQVMSWPDAPGNRLPEEVERSTIGAIRARFGASLVNYSGPAGPGPRPLWCSFDEGGVLEYRTVFERLRVAPTDSLLFYDERPYPGHVYVATLKEIMLFARDVPEFGFRSDVYVLPRDLAWCVAYTHEDDRQGHVLLLAGPVPLKD